MLIVYPRRLLGGHSLKNTSLILTRLDGWVAGVNIGYSLASSHQCLEIDQENA